MCVEKITKHHSHNIRLNSTIWFGVNIFESFKEVMTTEVFFLIVCKKSVVQIENSEVTVPFSNFIITNYAS